MRAEPLETIQPGAARGVGTLGWYGFWFLDSQEKAGYFEAGTGKSEIASMNVFNPMMDKFMDEYSGWCDFLGNTHRQWDVVLQQDLTANNLARYPIVVLPSVMTLPNAHISELRG